MKSDWGHLMFRFDGRINRARFWAGYVIVLAILLVAATYALAARSTPAYFVFALAFLATFWSSLALYVKRFHDRNKSGWWVLISLVPLIGEIWLFIELGLLTGTPGPNDYGPDPRFATP